MYRKLASVILVASAIHVKYAGAVGLGELTMRSALNQPLEAEIALMNIGDLDASQVIASLASQQDFSQANIDRTYFLTGIKFSVKLDGEGSGVIQLTSTGRLNEPYLDFLVEAKWPTGKMLRAYTALVDLPVYTNTQGEAVNLGSASIDELAAKNDTLPTFESAPEIDVVEPSPIVDAVEIPAEPAPVDNTEPENLVIEDYVSDFVDEQAQELSELEAEIVGDSSRYAETFEEDSYDSYSGVVDFGTFDGSYITQRHDTLWDIAQHVRPSSMTINQTMLAIHRLNQHAFVGNINRLKPGEILSFPSEDLIREWSAQEAFLEVKEQHRVWLDAEIDATSTTVTTPTNQQSTLETEGRLSLTSAGSGLANGSDDDGVNNSGVLSQQLITAKDELEAVSLENNELSDKLGSLETQVEQLERLIELKDAELASLQQTLGQAPAEALEQTQEAKALALEEKRLEEALAQIADDESSENVDIANDQLGLNEAKDEALEDTETDVEVTAIIDEEVVNEDILGEENQPLAHQEPSLLDKLIASPIYIGGFALLIVLAVVGFLLRKKGQQEKAVTDELNEFSFDGTDELDDDALSSNITGEHDSLDDDMDLGADAILVDDNENSDTDLSASADSDELDADVATESSTMMQTGDAIGEADIYIAYGRYDQAAELLQNAINAAPDDIKLRNKLLEVHLESRNKEGFQEQFVELKARGQHESISHAKELLTSVDGVDGWLDNLPGAAAAEIDDAAIADLDIDSNAENDLAVDIATDADFDLGDVSLDGLDDTIVETAVDLSAIPDLAESAPVQVVEENEFDLDMSDFEGDSDSSHSIEAAPVAASSSDHSAAAASSVDADFDSIEEEFDLDLSNFDEGALDVVTPGQNSEEDQVLAFDGLDLEDTAGDSVDSLDGLEGLDVSLSEDIDLDLSLGDELLEETPAVTEASPEAVDEHVDAVVDVEAAEIDVPAPAAETADSPLSALHDDDLEFLSDADEVSTKLDLARAYIDMGDVDGARDILMEVMKEGRDEQKSEATELLDSLD